MQSNATVLIDWHLASHGHYFHILPGQSQRHLLVTVCCQDFPVCLPAPQVTLLKCKGDDAGHAQGAGKRWQEEERRSLDFEPV